VRDRSGAKSSRTRLVRWVRRHARSGVLHELGDHHDSAPSRGSESQPPRGSPTRVESGSSCPPNATSFMIGRIRSMDLVEVHLLVHRHRQARHGPRRSDDTRAHPTRSAPRAPSALGPVRRACRRSNAATVCRLFFDPVVDPRGWWRPLDISARFGGASPSGDRVAESISRAARRLAPFDHQRQGSAAARWRRRRRTSIRQCSTPPAIRFRAHASGPPPWRLRTGSEISGPAVILIRLVALQLAGQAHPVIGRQRIGAGVGDDTVDIQPDEAVAPARGGGTRHGNVTDVREKVPCEIMWSRSVAHSR